jgi:hypothetical protein
VPTRRAENTSVFSKGLRPNFIKKAKWGYKILDMKPAEVAEKGGKQIKRPPENLKPQGRVQ